jgi:hypothetical protein
MSRIGMNASIAQYPSKMPPQMAASVRGLNTQNKSPAAVYASAIRFNTPINLRSGQGLVKPPE